MLLADDHPVLRGGIRAVLDAEPDLRVVAEAGDGPAAVAAAREHAADVVLLDLSMPGGGAAAVPLLLAARPGLRVLVLTMHADPAYRRACEAAGASGYLLKTAGVPEVVAAVRAVAAGGTAFDPEPAAPPGGLSRREREVLEYLVRGHTHQVIADRLSVSVKTVETYRARIREKTGLKSRADLVRHGLAAGLLAADTGEPAG